MAVRMTPEDHAQVTSAIAAAERGTSGEIVTIVTAESDSYRDVALHYCMLAMLAVPVLLALLPDGWADWLSGLVLGWNNEWTRGELMLAVAVLLIVAFLLARLLFGWAALLDALTPRATKARRVRRRAIAHFRAACEGKTKGRTGILIYLSLRERRAEIVADRAIHEKVLPERWGEAMAALVDEVKAGRIGRGMALAVGHVGVVLAEHLPRADDDVNELDDRLIEL